jgi:hypothetical protein
MKGGKIPMWKIDPRVLADKISVLLNFSTAQTVRASEAVRLWAENRSWENRKAEWRQLLLNP